MLNWSLEMKSEMTNSNLRTKLCLKYTLFKYLFCIWSTLTKTIILTLTFTNVNEIHF